MENYMKRMDSDRIIEIPKISQVLKRGQDHSLFAKNYTAPISLDKSQTVNVSTVKTKSKSDVLLYTYDISKSDLNPTIEHNMKELCGITHPNIIKFVEVYTKTPTTDFGKFQYNMTTSFVSKVLPRNLDKLIYEQGLNRSKAIITETMTKKWFLNILDALKVIHSKGFTHNNLCPSSIILINGDKDVLVSSFGFGMSGMIDYLQQTFIAPEVFDDRAFSIESDVFAFGVMFLKLIVLKDIDVNQMDQGEILAEIPKNYVDQPFVKFVLKCVDPDPVKRPKIQEMIDAVQNTQERKDQKKDAKKTKDEISGKKKSVTKGSEDEMDDEREIKEMKSESVRRGSTSESSPRGKSDMILDDLREEKKTVMKGGGGKKSDRKESIVHSDEREVQTNRRDKAPPKMASKKMGSVSKPPVSGPVSGPTFGSQQVQQVQRGAPPPSQQSYSGPPPPPMTISDSVVSKQSSNESVNRSEKPISLVSSIFGGLLRKSSITPQSMTLVSSQNENEEEKSIQKEELIEPMAMSSMMSGEKEEVIEGGQEIELNDDEDQEDDGFIGTFDRSNESLSISQITMPEEDVPRIEMAPIIALQLPIPSVSLNQRIVYVSQLYSHDDDQSTKVYNLLKDAMKLAYLKREGKPFQDTLKQFNIDSAKESIPKELREFFAKESFESKNLLENLEENYLKSRKEDFSGSTSEVSEEIEVSKSKEDSSVQFSKSKKSGGASFNFSSLFCWDGSSVQGDEAAQEKAQNELLEKAAEAGKLRKEVYQALERIGEGGSASVYLVRSLEDEQKYIMKVFNVGADGDAAQEVAAFNDFKERRLDSNHVVSFKEHFAYFDEEGCAQQIVIMEYCEERDLTKITKRRGKIAFHLTESEVLHIMVQVFDGLDYLHKQGYIHRDIKPENIFVKKNRVIKIGDFGFALRKDQTQDRVFGGTPKYMSPEQFEGPREIGTEFIDIWSAGAVFLELLTRKVRDMKMEVSANPDWLIEIWKKDDLVPRYSTQLRDQILKCFSRNPMERASAREMRDSLRALKLCHYNSTTIQASLRGYDTRRPKQTDDHNPNSQVLVQ